MIRLPPDISWEDFIAYLISIGKENRISNWRVVFNSPHINSEIIQDLMLGYCAAIRDKRNRK